MKYLLMLFIAIGSVIAQAEANQIFCELSGTSEYQELLKGVNSTTPLEIKIEIDLNKDSENKEKIDRVKFHQTGIQTPIYTANPEYNFTVEDKEIRLHYFLKEGKHPSIINLTIRDYEIKVLVNRYTGKAFLDGNIQGFYEDRNEKTHITDFLGANGDCVLSTIRKF